MSSALRDTLPPSPAAKTLPAPPPDAEQAICPTCLDDLLAEEPGPHCSYCAEAMRHLEAERETAPDLSLHADPGCTWCLGQGQRYCFDGAEDPGRMVACTCTEVK